MLYVRLTLREFSYFVVLWFGLFFWRRGWVYYPSYADLRHVHNSTNSSKVLAIAAEFQEAGHESWIVDDAEEAVMRARLPTRNTPAHGDAVSFRDFCLYAEEGRS